MSDQTVLWGHEGNGPRIPRGLAIRVGAITAAGALVLGLILGPVFAGKPALATDPSTNAPEHTIAVSGTATVSVSPDVADVTIGVVAEKPSVKEARDAAASGMTAVLAAVKKDGVVDKDIVTVNVSLEPVYDYSGKTPRLTGQRFTNVIRVTVRKIDGVPAVVDDAVAAGATQIQGISFRVGDPSAARAQAREAAVADARAKADALAKAGGVTIKGIASMTETAYTPPAPIMADGAIRMAAAVPTVSTPIQTGTTDVQIQLTVTYLIN